MSPILFAEALTLAESANGHFSFRWKRHAGYYMDRTVIVCVGEVFKVINPKAWRCINE